MRYSVVLMPGDGIGPEVMHQAELVLRLIEHKTGLRFDFTTIPCGGQYYLEHGADWPPGSEQACDQADVMLLGAVGWPCPSGRGPVTMPNGRMAGWSPVIGNRMRLDLYANVRPVRLLPGVQHRIHGRHRTVWEYGKVDIVFVRENTEDLYAGIGGYLERGGAQELACDTRIVTRAASERIIRKAFDLCERKQRGAPADGRKRVTCIDKENVLNGCKLFASIFHDVAAGYPDIDSEVALVDAFTQWLMGQPEHYDVCVTTNMFGDIVTDLASVLQGGMGLAVGCNVGDHHAMFEPIHGSAPRHARANRANPMAMILACAESLRWLGITRDDASLGTCAAAVEQAVAEVVLEGQTLTYDLVGDERACTMSAVGDAVRTRLNRLLSVGGAV